LATGLVSSCTADQFTGADGGGGGDASAGDGGVVLEASAPDAGPAFDTTNLVLWLIGDQGTSVDGNGRVTDWKDQSTYQNDAHPFSGAQAPLAVPSSLNGHTTLQFDARPAQPSGTMLAVDDDPSLQFGHNDFLVEIVVRYDNFAAGPPTTGALYNKRGLAQNADGITLATADNGTLGVLLADGATAAGVQSSTPFNDGNWHIVIARRSGTTLVLRADSTALGNTTVASGLTAIGPNLPVTIGASTNTTAGDVLRLDGSIAEMLAFHNAGGDVLMGTVEAYLKGKYNL
jgi:hypothetical protein